MSPWGLDISLLGCAVCQRDIMKLFTRVLNGQHHVNIWLSLGMNGGRHFSEADFEDNAE